MKRTLNLILAALAIFMVVSLGCRKGDSVDYCTKCFGDQLTKDGCEANFVSDKEYFSVLGCKSEWKDFSDCDQKLLCPNDPAYDNTSCDALKTTLNTCEDAAKCTDPANC